MGPTELARPDRPPGADINRGNGDNLRVVDVTVSDDCATS